MTKDILKYIESLSISEEEKRKLLMLIKMELGSNKMMGIQDSFTVSKGRCSACGREF